MALQFLPLYIDPGTGSMLFSLFIGIAAAATFGFRALFLKVKFLLSGGKKEGGSDSKTVPIVIFSDHKRYWNVFKPVCDEFENHGVKILYLTQSKDDPALSQDYKFVETEFIGEGNKGFAKLNFLHADIVLATTPGLDVYQWKRSKFVKTYVHIPHSVSDLAGYRMFGLDHYDVVLGTGINQLSSMRKIENLRPSIKQKDFFAAGCTYLDAMKKRLDESPNTQKKGEKIVLVAPSWGKSSILSKFGDEFLNALKNTGYKVIVRPHPQSVVSEQHILKPLQEKYACFEWNYDNDNFEVLKNADIMITDFSGVMFDYALVFDRPFIYADTNFDKSPYDIDWLEEPLWEMQILGKIGVQLKREDFSSIKSIIDKTIESTELEAARNRIRDEAWENRGKASSEVYRILMDILEKQS
ncbi:CDP-glycerol glycerophosphotransferase family protein [Treponema berlinense]|uniref:CDP-glycerol glycerophosphotransferase family protein n=1 Tax=Treponema berlinense TaxID=225004 RepID=UPI0026F12311|nr:CDP-glycerol glycerophosphotransferase family protein [Treponema berlinense]